MYQDEESRCNKCCGKSADIIWSVATPHLVRALRRKEVIRIAFRDGTHVNVSCDGRTLRVVKHDDDYVILEDEKDANGKASLMAINQVAFFPCDVVQSIIRTTGELVADIEAGRAQFCAPCDAMYCTPTAEDEAQLRQFLDQAFAQQDTNMTSRVTPDHIESIIVDERYFTAMDGAHSAYSSVGKNSFGEPIPESLALLTFCVLTLKNGFTVTGESACVSAENFNADIGNRIARENAINKIWPLEGYLLKERHHQQ